MSTLPPSEFSEQLAAGASIVDLMADLGEALNVNPNMLFLGGGNPAHIPAFERKAADALRGICGDEEALHKLLGVYQSPQGSERLIALLVAYLQQQGWPITERNVCLTAGSQSAFFMLFNSLAGKASDGSVRKICLPLVPEYLGYADQGLSPAMFQTLRPKIELMAHHQFQYHIDFDSLTLSEDLAAICVSRPTNPSGNVIADTELARLGEMADARGIPLIVDCAYGKPFPGVLYGNESLLWRENRIYVLSLSKLGLPGVRTGIVIADESIIQTLVHTNTVVSLANGNLGPALLSAFLEAGELDSICDELIVPFYRRKREFALAKIAEYFRGIDYRVHRSGGAFFLWFWFPSLKISSTELYMRLKQKNVLVMDGAHFFFEHSDSWDHAKQCIRITYCAADEVLDEAIAIIADELRQVC